MNMQYYYVHHHSKQGEPIWQKGKAYGYRKKNGHDQVFVRTLEGLKWIFAQAVDSDPAKFSRSN